MLKTSKTNACAKRQNGLSSARASKKAGRMRELPEGWHWSTLKSVSNGSGEYGAGLSGIAYSDKLYRYIRITDVNDDGSLNNDNPKSLSGAEAREFCVEKGDILFARSGATVGKTYYHDGSFLAAFAGYMIRFKIESHKANAQYVFAWTQSNEYHKWVTSMMRAGAQPNINAAEYGKMPILLPPLAEQERIVEILSDADAAISIAEKMLDKERVVARSTLAKALKAVTNDTVPLAELVDFQKGRPVAVEENGKGQPYIGSVSFEGHFSEFSNDPNGVPCVETDVLLLWDGYAGKVTTGLSGIVGSTVARLRPKEGINNEFLFGVIKNEYGRIRLIREGSAVPHLPKDFLKIFRVPAISTEKQSKIAAMIIEQRKQERIIEKLITALKKQKRGLMQQLLTGKLRVPAKKGGKTGKKGKKNSR